MRNRKLSRRRQRGAAVTSTTMTTVPMTRNAQKLYDALSDDERLSLDLSQLHITSSGKIGVVSMRIAISSLTNDA